MIQGLQSLLANRKKFVDEVSEIGQGVGQGNGSAGASSTFAKFSGVSFNPKTLAGFTGLQNQGATCYLNSLLQSLYFCPEFRLAIYNFKFDESIHGLEAQCLPRQLQKLFVMLQLTDRGAVSTAQLTNSFGWTSADSFTQQDVQECMAVIFEFLISGSDADLSSFLNSYWQGSCYDGLTCLTCQNSRGSEIAFRDIQLQVRGQNTLEQSLVTYLERETIEGVSCSYCNSQTPHSKGFSLMKLPVFLSLQLKRFDLDWNTFQRTKVQDKLTFPEALDMTPYLSCSDDQDQIIYDLVSVLIHTGSAFAGHYFCYVKTKVNEAGGSDQWLCFNDSTVTKLSHEEVQSCLGFTPAASETTAAGAAGAAAEASSETTSKPVPAVSNAYMLIYRRRREINLDEVSVDQIPQQLRDFMEEDNRKYNQLKAEYDYERAFHHLQVIYNKIPMNVKVHETKTVGELTEMVYNAILQRSVDAPPPPRTATSAAITSTSSSSSVDDSVQDIPASCEFIRLRVFDSIRGILLGPLGEGDRSKKLLELPKADLSRPLHVETCTSDRPFDNTFQETIPIEMVMYSTASNESREVEHKFSTAVAVQVPVTATMNDLVDKLRAESILKFNVSEQSVATKRFVICRVNVETGEASQVVGSEGLASAGLRASDSIYIDFEDQNEFESTSSLGFHEPRVLAYFNRIRNQIIVNFLVQNREGETVRSGDVSVDRRIALSLLKEQIGSVIEAEASKLCIFRSSSVLKGEEGGDTIAIIGAGAEIKNIEQSIQAAGIEDGANVIIMHGTPLLPHQFRIKLFLEAQEADREQLVSSTTTATSTEENEGESTLSVDFLSEFVVESDELVSTLKGRIYNEFSQRLSASNGGVVLVEPSADSSLLPLRLRIGLIRLAGGVEGLNRDVPHRLGAVLRDASTVSQCIKAPASLRDGLSLVLQVGKECVGAISGDDVLISIRQWDPRRGALLKGVEITLSKDATYKSLRERIESDFLAVPSDFEESGEKSVLLAKPFNWQLKDLNNLPTLKWDQQPRDESKISAAPWRLADSSVVVFVLASEYQAIFPPEVVSNATASAHFPNSAPETGFRIYSSQEQLERKEKERLEQEEMKSAIAARMEAMMALRAQK